MEVITTIPPSVVLCVSAAMVGCAIVAYRARRYGVAFGFILALGILLRVFAATDAFLHLWDESFHAVVAKHCMTNPLRPTLYAHPALQYDFRNWLANHVWLHKPPLALWLMAGSLRLFGVHEVALRFPSILLSSLVIFLTYRIGSMLWSRRHGLIASALCAANYHLVDLASGRDATDHVDSLLVTLVSLGAFFVLKATRSKRPLVYDMLVGICIGLAYLTKCLPGLLPLGLWLIWAIFGLTQYSLSNLMRRLLVVVVAAVAISVPWSIYTHVNYPLESAWESSYSLRHVHETLEGHDHPWHYYIGRMDTWLGPVSYLAVCYALWSLFRQRRHVRNAVFILAWFLTPHIVFSLVATKMPAYVTISAVAGFLLAATFILDSNDLVISRFSSHTWQRWVLLVMLFVLVCAPLKRTLKRLHLIREYERSPAWARDLRDLAIAHPGTNTVVFAVPHAIAAMFYGDFAAYNYLPTRYDIETVVSNGRDVVVFNQGSLPQWVEDLDGVQVYTPRRRREKSQQDESTVPSKAAPGASSDVR